jgi:hypothetical protein
MYITITYKTQQELGVPTWNDEIDVAPEVLYCDATGESLPDWMQEESGLKETA